MNMLWIAIYLLFCRSLAEEEEDPEYVMKYIYNNQNVYNSKPIGRELTASRFESQIEIFQNKLLFRGERYLGCKDVCPKKLMTTANTDNDFRCFKLAFSRFNYSNDDYYKMYYSKRPYDIGCASKADGKHRFYPDLTALDPMMPFYIRKVYEGTVLLSESDEIPLDIPSKIRRSAIYCLEMRMIGSTFLDYIEIFHSDDELCLQIKEIVKECSTFRQAWFIWTRQVYERFCLGESGCYTTMEFYEDDIPHCVKHIAKGQFQNVTYGSWHHSIINYCQLTDMVPEAKDKLYDRAVLFEDDKTEDDLLSMCQFLRFRLLPEEGKEEEIREITLENRENEAIDADKDSAAFFPIGTSYIAIIMLNY